MANTSQSVELSRRSDRLAKLLHAFLVGHKPVQSSRDVQQLLQAICDSKDHALCVEKIACRGSSLDVLRNALRLDISSHFINGSLASLLTYLTAPEVKRLANGEFLRRVLCHVVSPPSLWNAMIEAHQQHQLTHEAELRFAWLLLELLTWSGECPVQVDDIATNLTEERRFLHSETKELRDIGERVRRIIATKSYGVSTRPVGAGPAGPGGRHDNDFVNYREIAIYPTEDELACKERPYYNIAHALRQTPLEERVGHHLENQFRLLREDFLAELRDDIAVSSGSGKSPGRLPRTRLSKLRFRGLHCGTSRRRYLCSIKVSFESGLSQLRKENNRKAFLRNNPNILRNNSFGYLVDQEKVVAFGTIIRDETLLSEEPPVLPIRIPESDAMQKVLRNLATSNTVDFVLIDTAMFAYEPILRCLQEKVELPLWKQLLAPEIADMELCNLLGNTDLLEIARQIESAPGRDLKDLFGVSNPVKLDESQIASLIAALRQSVSLVKGLPGSGKSFLGALLAKLLHDSTQDNILVICYTNHALDQFIEDLLSVGIASDSMVRLGSKCSKKTQHISLQAQVPKVVRSQDNWDAINRLNPEVEACHEALQESVGLFQTIGTSRSQLLEYLEISDNDYNFFLAFEVPEEQDGFHRVGKNNQIVDKFYLIDRWLNGEGPGMFSERLSSHDMSIWKMDTASREEKFNQWTCAMRSETLESIAERAAVFDRTQHTLKEAWGQLETCLVQQKRIVACTTTGAAMYTKQLQGASPGILLVEEAGEILESHILTALTPSVNQLILIGDHQQLRPKYNNHALSVEKGDGYDFNRSLFERLVLSGFSHTSLRQQHRMCPEISSLVRHLTYPELLDAPSTTARQPLRGLRRRIVFIKHKQQELNSEFADRRDHNASRSKQNLHEAQFVKKIVKYLAQQGYGTSDQVVLTPYLAQLGLLRRELAKDNDPVLNDLDSAELVRAGLISQASASQVKRPIHLSTIDNYQGEESNIVIASLTRSNPDGDIGFMYSPERLNVLLSRARDALILIGNPATFLGSRKGKDLWKSFFDMLAKTDSIFEGFPVRCEQHKDRQMFLETPADFDKHCPDGGCSAPCGVLLGCGLHACPRKCHRVADHTKVECEHPMSDACPQGHVVTRKCSDGHPTSCRVCDAEAAAKLARQQRDLNLELKRQEKQRLYAKELAEIEEQINSINEESRVDREQQQHATALEQRQMDLKSALARKAQREAADRAAQSRQKAQQASTTSDSKDTPNSSTVASPATETLVPRHTVSAARLDWEHQKQFEGATNAALDKLMDLIGLENIKEQFLEIKSEVDLLVRQNLFSQIEKTRFGSALMGNPGTGKTTVARLYANFLCSVGVLPGEEFVESTGSKLANEGVQGCKKLLDNLLNKGGGAFFIDEAYQLTSGSSQGGGAVLEFLLAEIENLTGKVVFILAGYTNQMEKFFQYNPGLQSRFPRTLKFPDYEVDELLSIFLYNLHKRYEKRMVLEGGEDGLFARIVVRRIGRGRGKDGFGNAREVENVLARIASRQAKRVRKERKAMKKDGTFPDDLLFTQTDLIGPEPSNVLSHNQSWAKLLKLTGLQSVKNSIKALFDTLTYNYRRELAEEPLVQFSLNKVFLGNPGTGKTTVAKLYGQILADIGMLSSGEVVVKKPADFVGSVIGASEANAKGILDAAVGKVLLIDEAYGLHPNTSGTSGKDPYRTAVIDTIVAEVQNVPGDDRCVLLLGYRQQIEEMMQNSNPGLARRFPIDSGFSFEDFSDEEMAAIFDYKLQDSGYKATPRGRDVALKLLQRARNRPHFGNAGEIDILLNDAKMLQQKRISKETDAPKNILEAQDFDPKFDRGERAVTNIAMLFKDTVGCETIVAQLQDYQDMAANLEKLGQDPRAEIPFSFLFRGPPGTGKTTTATKMGKVFYDLGFLSKAEVVICSASDLIGEYVGQTGPKTRKLLESALGKVLFIDEAYRLGDGHFAKEAMDELVDCMTNERFYQKLIIILAGYDADMNRLMSSNPGLTSRFPETMVFEPLKPEDCLALLLKALGNKKGIEIMALSTMTSVTRSEFLERFETLAGSANFANARDVLTLSSSIYARAMKRPKASSTKIHISPAFALESVDKMIAERTKREFDAATIEARKVMRHPHASFAQEQKLPDSMSMNSTSIMATEQESQRDTGAQGEAPADPTPTEEEPENNQPTAAAKRDAGVSDAIWEQLQLDRQKAEEAEREVQEMREKERKLQAWLRACADAQVQKELEELERRRREAEEKKRLDAKAQQLLDQMGCCPVGYAWIRQTSGYRCAGGSHWIDEKQVADWMARGGR